MSRRLASRGLSVTVPSGWDGTITTTLGDEPGEGGAVGTTNALLQVATFRLPAVRGDFGGGAVERMGRSDLFVALVEFDPAAVGTELFSQRGIAPLLSAGFRRETMHRPVPGQAGHQQFFHQAGRAFCLYIAVGSARARATLAHAAALVVSTVGIDPR